MGLCPPHVCLLIFIGLRTSVREIFRSMQSCDVVSVLCKPIMCDVADAPKSEMIQCSGGSLPSPPVLGLGECLKFQCEEGCIVPGTLVDPLGSP